MVLQWTEALATGVEEIDNQHKELFRRINNLRDAMKQGKGRMDIGTLLKFLEDYVVSHFSAEEKFMARENYPDTDYHKEQHSRFREAFAKLKGELEAGTTEFTDLVVTSETNSLLGNWWINHISKVDKALGAFLKTKV